MGHSKIDATEARIQAARTTLAERLARLEDRVTDSVEQAKETVDHATSEVRGTVSDATKSARELFINTAEDFRGVLDLRRQVRDHPWQGVLLAVGAGLARLISSRKNRTPVLETDAAAPGPVAELIRLVRRELVNLGETAVSTASKKLRENIETLSGSTPEPSRRETVGNGFAHDRAYAS